MLLIWWVKQDYATPLEDLINYVEKHIMLNVLLLQFLTLFTKVKVEIQHKSDD